MGKYKVALSDRLRVGYVLRRYPNYSETFIVNEILAHEAAGLTVEIFALRPPKDTHFQDLISKVRGSVNYLHLPDTDLATEEQAAGLLRANPFWTTLQKCSKELPDLWRGLEAAEGEEAGDVYQALLLAREARLRGIDHLHAHFATTAATVARLAARFARLPYTFTAHANDIFNMRVRPDDLRHKLSDAAAVITVSDYHVRYLRERYGAAAAGVRRVLCGLDLERFPFEAPQDRSARVVAVGRLVEKKGFGDLIDACAILAGRGRVFSCDIIGAGPLEADLRARIERLGLEGTVELTGPRPQNEVIQHVRSAAVLAAPCVIAVDGDRDGLPNVLLEAMALGTPCVSTDVTGIPQAVRDGETGLLAPQHNPAELAAAIERLLVDPALRVRLAGGARRLIEAEFDIHRNAGYIREIFREVSRARVGAAQKVS